MAMSPVADSQMKLEKAFLTVKSGTEGGVSTREIQCQFNPKEYSISKSASWRRTPARGARSAPRSEFTGTNPRTIQMELFLDAWESGGDVSEQIDALFEWTNPTPSTREGTNPTPPIVIFHWGKKFYFDAYVKSVNAKYTMFLKDGTPVRATATVSLEEVPAEPGAQNPTSGGIAGRRTRTVGAGDSLQSIAYAEYDDPTLWRGVAAANGIDDPMRLDSGTTLLVPNEERARELAEVDHAAG